MHGQYEAWKRYGWLPWKQLVQPAIDLARNGFEITEAVADVLTKEMEKDIRNDPGLRLVNVMYTVAKLQYKLYVAQKRAAGCHNQTAYPLGGLINGAANAYKRHNKSFENKLTKMQLKTLIGNEL